MEQSRIDELLAQADLAKRRLDAIDARIEQNPALERDYETMMARRMYSAEWRACIDMARKSEGAKQEEKPKPSKAEAIRSSMRIVRPA